MPMISEYMRVGDTSASSPTLRHPTRHQDRRNEPKHRHRPKLQMVR
jgi:hypothetical protein